jgi:hypothetical protein
MIEGSTRASTHSCHSPHAANNQSAQQQQQQQQQQQRYIGRSSQQWGALGFYSKGLREGLVGD